MIQCHVAFCVGTSLANVEGTSRELHTIPSDNTDQLAELSGTVSARSRAKRRNSVRTIGLQQHMENVDSVRPDQPFKHNNLSVHRDRLVKRQSGALSLLTQARTADQSAGKPLLGLAARCSTNDGAGADVGSSSSTAPDSSGTVDNTAEDTTEASAQHHNQPPNTIEDSMPTDPQHPTGSSPPQTTGASALGAPPQTSFTRALKLISWTPYVDSDALDPRRKSLRNSVDIAKALPEVDDAGETNSANGQHAQVLPDRSATDTPDAANALSASSSTSTLDSPNTSSSNLLDETAIPIPGSDSVTPTKVAANVTPTKAAHELPGTAVATDDGNAAVVTGNAPVILFNDHHPTLTVTTHDMLPFDTSTPSPRSSPNGALSPISDASIDDDAVFAELPPAEPSTPRNKAKLRPPISHSGPTYNVDARRLRSPGWVQKQTAPPWVETSLFQPLSDLLLIMFAQTASKPPIITSLPFANIVPKIAV